MMAIVLSPVARMILTNEKMKGGSLVEQGNVSWRFEKAVQETG